MFDDRYTSFYMLLEVAWNICQMFSFNSFSASTRSKHSPSLFTCSSLVEPRLRLKSFHQGLEHHSRPSTSHLSTRHSTPYHRFTGYHGDTTAVHDIATVAREITWPWNRWMCSSIGNEDRIIHAVVAYIHFRQVFALGVRWWMGTARCVDLVHCYARVATG